MVEMPVSSASPTPLGSPEVSSAAPPTPCVQLNTVPLRALIRPPTCSLTKSADTTTILTRRGFPNLLQARAVIETWRREYNEERPKKALGGMTPEAYAKHLAEVRL